MRELVKRSELDIQLAGKSYGAVSVVTREDVGFFSWIHFNVGFFFFDSSFFSDDCG